MILEAVHLNLHQNENSTDVAERLSMDHVLTTLNPSQLSQALKKCCSVGLFSVEFSGLRNCSLYMTTYNTCYVV